MNTQEGKLSNNIRDIVYGGNDGIVTTFAVVAGFTGAQLEGNIATLSFAAVLLFGLANLFSDAASMGLGNLLSLRSEHDVYNKKKEDEEQAIQHHPDQQKKDTIQLYKTLGLSEKDAKEITEILQRNPEHWKTVLMTHKHKMHKPDYTNATRAALSTFIAFIIFGIFPLLPYLVLSSSTQAFLISCIASSIALLLLGTLRWKFSEINIARALTENIIIGGTAALIALLVGSLF